MLHVQKLTPCLWFDGQAEEAASSTAQSSITQNHRHHALRQVRAKKFTVTRKARC